ncbi:cell wall hydrolase [Ferdinandcohnia quinoae]|uniref:Cell wall hydrolase n=1 Tax=Fredinandcohnia quinoae TaxID=2918902 RepID=A0AAW5E236_9BACI|nr:cell wall hydrolase [Fredinandcohnia sp. SECRCQ15]MCH1626970.1 cell wall hydrolase [Fredinandcohnia sp. SECRCQ15]
MKKLKGLLLASTLTVSLFAFHTNVDAASSTHTVKSGDTLWKIGMKYGVSVLELRDMNNKISNMIYPGQRLVIPQTISASDKELLARLVQAEAKGEPYAGKVAVATVVLNRVDSPLFPNTVKKVIYERSENGSYAFTPVQNGQINQAADSSAKKAVEEALTFRGQGKGSLYFYNPETSKSKWILSREVTTTIGNHRFAK